VEVPLALVDEVPLVLPVELVPVEGAVEGAVLELVEGVLPVVLVVLLPAGAVVVVVVVVVVPDCELVPDCEGAELALLALADSPLALGVVDAPALAGALLLLLLPAEALTFSLSFTFRTPGTDSAIWTARLRSSSEATVPFSLTSPFPFTLTSTFENAGSVAN
jgi:hypothetical protein